MTTYRECLLLNAATCQCFSFTQALRWMDAYETYEVRKEKLRPRKKRASRLNTMLTELQRPAPQSKAHSYLADLQPFIRIHGLGAVLPSESESSVPGPVFASYSDSTLDVGAFANSAYMAWRRHRALAMSDQVEVFLTASSSLSSGVETALDESVPYTKAIQIAEIFTRMFCSADPHEREASCTFRSSDTVAQYVVDPQPKEIMNPESEDRFRADATYIRDGRRVEVFLPCAFSHRSPSDFRRFIETIVDDCQRHDRVFELWQAGLNRDLK